MIYINNMNSFINKIFLENKLKNIKNSLVKQYLLNFFSIKVVGLKLITLCMSLTIIFTLFFVLRNWALTNYTTLHIVFNTGWAFGLGSNLSTGLVYFLKSLPTIFFFIGFIVCNKWYLFIPMCIISFSSLCNIIDKSLIDYYVSSDGLNFVYDSVVDYFYFSSFNFTNNIADIIIIIGFVLLVCALIYYIILEYNKEKQNEKNSSEERRC